MKAKPILIALSILILVLAAFYLGQRTQIPHKKKIQAKKVTEPRTSKKKSPAVPSAILSQSQLESPQFDLQRV